MKLKKMYNPDGSTRRYVVRHDTGSYSSYTPKQAVQMIALLTRALWSGRPLRSGFTETP